MTRSRHTEAQMIGALKQLEAGGRRKMWRGKLGVSKHTIYAWEGEVRRLKSAP